MVDGKGVCTVCPLTTYSSEDGQTECTRCPERTDTINTGSLWKSDCIGITEVNYSN